MRIRFFILIFFISSCKTPSKLCRNKHVFHVTKINDENGNIKKKLCYLPFGIKRIKEYHKNGKLKVKGRTKTYGAGFDYVVCYSANRGKWKYRNEKGKLIRTEKYSRKQTDLILKTKHYE